MMGKVWTITNKDPTFHVIVTSAMDTFYFSWSCFHSKTFFSIHNFANKGAYALCICLCNTTNAQRVLVSKKNKKKVKWIKCSSEHGRSFSGLAIGSSCTHASAEAIKKESFPRTTGAGQTGVIMQKNRNLERNLVNKKAMFLAIQFAFRALCFFFFQL